MKLFSRFLMILVAILLGIMVYYGGVSARNDKFVTEEITKKKINNEAIGNKDKDFIKRTFGLYQYFYRDEAIGNFTIKENVLIGDVNYDVSFDASVYQVIPLNGNAEVKEFYFFFINELTFDNILPNGYKIKLFYEKEITDKGTNVEVYYPENFDFPIFIARDFFQADAKNRLLKIEIGARTLEKTILTILFDEQTAVISSFIETPFLMTDLVNNHLVSEKMYDDIASIYQMAQNNIPSEAVIFDLNELGYSYFIFENEGKYNYLIFIYLGIYLVGVGTVVYFMFFYKN